MSEAPAPPAILVQELSKAYNGRQAVSGLNLRVEAGDIFGFVGPNGAGKTSTLRMIATLLEPDEGEIQVYGHPVDSDSLQVRALLGYMPDTFGVYNDMRVGEYLEFFAACYRTPPLQRPALISDLLELVELAHRREDTTASLSRGMQQRLSLARTLIHDPQVLVLDEPAAGLDPRARVEIRQLMLQLASMGKTILFSTHILADVAEICTRVGIIEAGKLVACGTVAELHRQVLPRRQVLLTVLDQADKAQFVLAGVDSISGVSVVETLPSGRATLRFEFLGDDAALSQVLGSLFQNGLQVLSFSEERHDLEQVFLRTTQGLVT